MLAAFVIVIVAMIGASLVEGNSIRENKTKLEEIKSKSVSPQIDGQSITVQSTGMIMVDKKVLRSLLDDAKRQGTDLNVAIYEYDQKTELWNRAEKWCK